MNEKEDIMTPWEVTGNVNGNDMYDRLVNDFGCERISSDLIYRFIKVTGHQPHKWLRRGLFFAHRGLHDILNDYEKGLPIFIYTGRGPTSESLHLGHIIAMEFTQWLQQVFKATVVFQIADDEKFYFKDNLSYEQIREYAKENIKDILAMNFDLKNTFIFLNHTMMYDSHYQQIGSLFKKHVSINQIKKIFGLDDTSNIGQLEWPIWQSVPAFSESFYFFDTNRKIRCLVAYAIDQDPYFRLARDLADKLDMFKPCSIMCRFLPALEGNAKMSSSSTKPNIAPKTIFLTSTSKEIKDMINRHAFSGGAETKELHEKNGGNPDLDVAYQWLRHFLEDDNELQALYDGYKAGKILSGQMKAKCIQVVIELVKKHQEKRAMITDDILQPFITNIY